MSKNVRLALFMLGATVFNIVTSISVFIVLTVLYGKVLAPYLPQQASTWSLPVIFGLSVLVAFVFYRAAVKKLTSTGKFDDIFYQ